MRFQVPIHQLKSGARWAVFAAVALLLAACATATPYAPSDGLYGYSEQAIESDRYRVSFRGNANTERSTVENYLLFRVAELTIAQGYNYFILSERVTEAETTIYEDPVVYGHYHHGYHFPYYAVGFHWGYPHRPRRSTEVTRFEAVAYVLLRRGEIPEDVPAAYDAMEVIENLGPLVVRPGA